MKLFKKALLATAIFGAMGAQAASISSDAKVLSAEGVAFKVAPAVTNLTFDVVVSKDHPSSSIITINFDDKVDLKNVTVNSKGLVTQAVGGGQAYSGDVGFDYGTGSFTFDDIKLTKGDRTKGETDSISFKVNLGNPLTANSAFRVVIGKHNFGAGVTPVPVTGTDTALISGASSIDYVSTVSATDDTVIETGTGVLAEEKSQFSFELTQDLDGVISRTDEKAWTYTGSSALTTDELKYKFVNDETLTLALNSAVIKAQFTGNFKGVEAFDNVTTATNTPQGVYATIPAVPSATAPVTAFTISYPANAGAKSKVTEVVTFDNGSSKAQAIPVTGEVTGQLILTGASNVGTGAAIPTTGYVIANDIDAGQWAIDATIINVPYVPVNATDTQTFIHFANETDKAVDVIVSAIDGEGNKYGPMDLGMDLPANTVYKLSMPAMDTLFNLEGASTKLSVTFNIDADKGDVNAYAVSQNGKGRTEVSTSQQRGN